MAQICKSTKPMAVRPVKSGQPLGAILASLGLSRCLPLIHGAQGCSAFAKIFFIQHFHEPIPLQSTALDPVTTIMGSDDNVVRALATLCEKQAPKIITLLSSGLAEAQGADMNRAIKAFRQAHPKFERIEILPVATPDFYGSLENGYAALVERLIEQLVPEQPIRSVRKKRLNLLLSHMLTPGDIELIQRYVEAFGFTPVLVPDLSTSLDGHLLRGDYLGVSQGGTELGPLRQLGQSQASLVIGASLQHAGQLLQARTGVETHVFPHLMTLAEIDRFILLLSELSQRPVPAWIERSRGQLQDAMIDTHGWINGRRFGIAAEADHLVAWLAFALSVGLQPASVIAPVNQPALLGLPVERVQIGDLEDLQDELSRSAADMLFSNSHASELADELGLPLLRIGFPLFDAFGEFRRTRQGYAGLRDTLFELANLMQRREHRRPAYHSPLKQQFAQSVAEVAHV